MVGYVTILEADDYVATRYLSKDALRIAWEALSEQDKSVLLQKSFDTIEQLPFAGKKFSTAQPNAFPRGVNYVPNAIKYAQIENALSLTDMGNNEDAAFYERLWQFGIESYSIGNLSERSGSGAWGRNSPNTGGVVSSEAARLLRPYVTGSYRIRGL